MIFPARQKAYALLTAVWMSAILASISMAGADSLLANTRAAQADLQRIQADLLLNSGLRYAALSIASPRSEVVADAIPVSRLVYANDVADVAIEINNEAGFIDLLAADPRLLAQLLSVSGLNNLDGREVERRLRNWKLAGGPFTYRQARRLLADKPGLFERLVGKVSLYNSQSGIHPLLAAEQVLELVPDLAPVDVTRLVQNRRKKSPSLFESPVESDFFSARVSPYYRITTRVTLGGQLHRRTQVINMTNQPGRLFELVATL